MKKVTAGRDYLGAIAPQFTHLTVENPDKEAPKWLDRLSKEDYDKLEE